MLVLQTGNIIADIAIPHMVFYIVYEYQIKRSCTTISKSAVQSILPLLLAFLIPLMSSMLIFKIASLLDNVFSFYFCLLEQIHFTD